MEKKVPILNGAADIESGDIIQQSGMYRIWCSWQLPERRAPTD
jgi:hypothetical protein